MIKRSIATAVVDRSGKLETRVIQWWLHLLPGRIHSTGRIY